MRRLPGVLRRLGGRQAPTGVFPVLFDPMMAAGLIDHFVSAASGGALYRKASFLVDTAGTQVFNPVITLEEDPFILRGMASGAFDNEGVATRARTVVEQGVLTGYFLSSYSAAYYCLVYLVRLSCVPGWCSPVAG